MQKQFEEIEQKLMALYAEFKKEVPAVHCLNFTVSQVDKDSEPYLYRFIHTDNNCRTFYNSTGIYAFWRRHQILFQKFNPI